MSSAMEGVVAIICVLCIYWIYDNFPPYQYRSWCMAVVVCRFRSLWMILRPLELAAQKEWFAMSTTCCTPAATKCLCCISERAFWVRPSWIQCVGCNRCWKQRFYVRLRSRCNKKLRDEAAYQWILQCSGLRAPGPWRRWYHLSLREADLWLLASCLWLTETAGHFSCSFLEMTAKT